MIDNPKTLYAVRHAVLAAMLLAAPMAQAAVPPSCPPEPVRVIRSIGEPTEYRGSYPGIPDLCLVTAQGQQAYAYFGNWRADWPGAGEAYPAIKTVVAGPAGTRTEFVTRSVPGMQWQDSFINQGTETLVVDGRRYVTLKLAHERKGIEGNTYHSIITGWRDVRTGVTLKTVEDQISGQSYGPMTTWEAVRVEPIR